MIMSRGIDYYEHEDLDLRVVAKDVEEAALAGTLEKQSLGAESLPLSQVQGLPVS